MDAELIFWRAERPNEHCWTAIIVWYAQTGNLKHALHLYQAMNDNGIHPSDFTIVGLLKSSGKLGNITVGHQIHNDVIQKGFDSNIFIGSTLIDMYGECNLSAEAWEIFHRIANRDVVICTSMINWFAENGETYRVIDCLHQMQHDGVSPNAFTLSCVLKACNTDGMVFNLHQETVLKGFEKDFYVGKSLVAAYAKIVRLREAQQIFDSLSIQDVVSWTVLLSGYDEYGDGEEAIKCFDVMRLQGIRPDSFTFSCVMKACSNTGALEKGLEIHKEITQEALEKDPIVGSTLVCMYASCGCFPEALEVFHELPEQSVVSWNALIGGFAEHGLTGEALKFMFQMQKDCIFPDAFTFSQSMKICASIGSRCRGQRAHMECVLRGYESENVIGCSIVGMYAKLGLLQDAQIIFDHLHVKDAVSWTSLITGYAEHGYASDALQCFDQMQKLDILADDLTFACILKACGSVGASGKGYQLHQEVLKKGIDTDIFVGMSLLELYSKDRSPREVDVIFSNLLVQDVISWNSLISGFGIHEGYLAVKCFENMLLLGVKPDDVTFSCVLSACSHASLVHEGQEFLRMMMEEYTLSPSTEHYTCMIDLLARTGLLHEALKCLGSMASPPDMETWRALLSACRMYGGSQLASTCIEHLLHMNTDVPMMKSCNDKYLTSCEIVNL
ncbi:hypothetical protein KP509_14G094700 [Ceratopteris richardii]|nr:hypothetical protein KP509_14G094700 [Ceratopteris richardii]